MKKLLSILILAVLMLSLFSCKPKNDNPDSGGNDDIGNTDTPNERLDIGLVYADPSLQNGVGMLMEALADFSGVPPILMDDGDEKSCPEIVLGMTSRPISEEAYRRLDRIEREGADDVAYLVYSDGESIAIVFDDDGSGLDVMANMATRAFIDKCLLTDKTLSYQKGNIVSDSFDIVERQNELDAPEVDAAWAELEKAAGENGGEIVEAMKALYALSSDDLISWFANLYDPAIGGYYYSNSGRDTYGFLPDIESTAQALGFITSSGLVGDQSLREVLPDWMQLQIAEYIKGLQDPNGFFYHPQWTKELTDSKLSRRARDLGNAVSVLNSLGYRPTYNTPNGDKGDGMLFDGTPVSAKRLTENLGGSSVAAVSKVIPAAVAVPSHLKDKDAFIAYLESLDIRHNSYSAGNTLTAQKAQIIQRDRDLAAANAGYSLMDILINFLNENQFENGLWHEEENYYAVNGLMKIGGVYSGAEVLMPRADKAVMAAIRAMTTDEEAGAVTDIYNTWFAISRTLRHMRDYGTDEDEAKAAELLKEVYRVAPEALRTTAKKLSAFKKLDGSFSYTPNYSSPNSQGCPVAVPGSVEGDVNATVICTHDIINYVYSALDLSEYEVPQFTYGDWINYLIILNNLGSVIKDEEEDNTDPVTFDDGEIDYEPEEITVVKRSPEGYATVIADPREGAEGNVVDFKSCSGYSDQLTVRCTSPSTVSRSCYIFEADLCVRSTNSSYPIQIFMGECYMLTLRTSGDKVRVVESTSSSSKYSKDTTVAPTVNIGEWFNIRAEYYPGEMDSVRIKIYFNGELTAVTDGFYDELGLRKSTGNAAPSSDFGFTEIYVMKNAEVNLLVDNLYCYKSNQRYKAYTDTEKPLLINVDEPARVYEIDDTAAGKGAYYTKTEVEGTRYDFSKELTLSELYDKSAGTDPVKTLNTFYEDGKLRVKNDSNWKGIALTNTATKTPSGDTKYVFECDFTWLYGKQSDDVISGGAAFIGLLGEHDSVDNNYMFTYGTLNFDANNKNRATLFGYEIDRCKTYNLRIEHTVGVGTKVFFNGTLAETKLSVGKSTSDASFAGFGIYMRKGFEFPLIFDIDNVFMNTVALDESDYPKLDKDFETYYDGADYEGTRYGFSEDFTLDVYNAESAPKGILAAEPTEGTASDFTKKNSSLQLQRGALRFNIASAAWTGFTVANRGNTSGGAGHTYVFEADFCYLGGTLKSGTTDYKIAFAGMTSGNENNANMAKYDYITLNDKEGTSLTWHGYKFDRGEIYNVRIVYVVGGEYKFFVNGKEVYKPTVNTTKAADTDTYAGFAFYFRGRSDNLNITLDNVFMANYAPGEVPTPPVTQLVKIDANVPTLPEGTDTFYDYAELDGTRYDFSEEVKLEVYNKDTAPNGILAADLYKDSAANFPNGNNALEVKDGALVYTVNESSWCGFTIAYKGDRVGGDRHTYIFEADFTYNGGILREGAADGNICFAGMTTGNENNTNFMKYGYMTYTDDCSGLKWCGYTFEKGVTYNVRIVFVVGVSYSFYVNGEAVTVSGLTEGASPDSFAGFGFYFRKRADDFSFTFDNVYMANIAPTVTIE